MSVTARPNDTGGSSLDTKIANITAAKAATTSTALKEHLAVQLDRAQQEAVIHYMEHGRITAATILSTLA